MTRRNSWSVVSRGTTRREFIGRAAALGLSVGAAAALFDACAGPSSVGVPGASPGSAPSEVQLAILYPQSGDIARFGQACLKAAQLAAEDINAAGGIRSLGGAKLKLVVEDITSDATTVRTVVERILTQNKVAAACGSYASALTLVATEVSERAGIPWLTGSIADTLTSRNFKHLFQVSPKASHFGQAQMKFFLETFGAQGVPRIAILYENTEYGTTTAKGIRDAAKAAKLEVVLDEAYSARFTDATPLVTKVKNARADVLFPVSYLGDAILLTKGLKQFGVKVAVVGGGAGYLVPEFLQQAGQEGAEGLFSVASWNWDLTCKGVDSFASRYKDKNGEFLMEHAGEQYAMTWIAAAAIDKAASADPAKVRDALASLSLNDGDKGAWMPACAIKFDQTGWNEKVHPVMIQWQSGAPRTVWPAADARTKPKL